MEAINKVITSQNAGNCTAYELRQELVRRGAFDLDENKVNFKALLQRLMIELVAEEKKITEEKTQTILNETNIAREQAKLEREKKKLEALERSKQRQANPEYFQKKIEENTAAITLKEKEKNEHNITTVVTTLEEIDHEQEEEGQNNDDDPFRTYKSKTKSKIFVK